MEFEKRKAATLAAMASTEVDKSPKGTIDAPIIPLLKTLNLHPSYFSTSSCSGRISILSQPSSTTTTTTAAAATSKKKARGGSWLFISHEPADPDSVIDLLFPSDSSTSSTQEEGDLVFRFEPFILAVECKDISSAQSLVSTAISCGFRESGITNAHKRVIIAIRCSIRLEVPLGSTGQILVSPDYVRFLVRTANEKMELNRKRTDGFLQVLESKFLVNEESLIEVEEKDDNKEEADSSKLVVGDGNSGKSEFSVHLGLLRAPQCSVSVVKMVITGEPVDKLFLWGHSACTLKNIHLNKVLVFGGFGGLGRHSRRNDTLILDPQSGTLEAINADGPPSPRLGHTSLVVGECVFVIGGREDPTKILNDVWVFNTAKNEWRLLECTGSMFPSRHRHAAAVVGSKIYVFGGLDNEMISSSMHVLDVENMQWSEISMQGEWPSARHSHSMVSNGSQLFMFGGYDGEKALGDLYSFDTRTCLWKKEKTAGRTPYARFSHSMFIYNNLLGIVGGCPVKQHFEEVALLDMRLRLWKHVTLNSVGKDLFVRSTSNVVGDDLVIVGGGASCYAFGTKFSEPMKMSLLPFTSSDDALICSDMEEKPIRNRHKVVVESNNSNLLGASSVGQTLAENSNLIYKAEALSGSCKHHAGTKHWVLQLERKYAKLGKDILKKFGWLDLGRKVYSCEDGLHICLPVTAKFYALFFNKKEHAWRDALDFLDGVHPLGPVADERLSIKDVSGPTALNLLLAYGGSIVIDEVASVRKTPKSPQKIMVEAVGSLIKHRGLPQHLLEQIPTRWERLGDIVVLPVTSFKDQIWDSLGQELWITVAKSLGTRRLARQGRIAPTGTRDSTLEILVGDNGWVDHRENGILYSFDVTKCMFSWGNLSEKLRMASLDCKDEVIVDLFAGIGYFVLPFLVGAKAKLVYACEWNPNAIEALRRNVQVNSVADRCVILEGDNRDTAPKRVADRVCLGLLPTSEESWLTAVRALRIEGGMLHVHGNVKDSEETTWSEYVAKSISDIATTEGCHWEVSVQHVERVKWYGPHIRHLVADVRCKQLQM
ncbi:tRNA transferase Trm5/Tyw2 [Macleaya cordata]|uniref:tRNA transferase Trm5/Tyw2 n=1 Tax=Macleaya cordata TaxID=56857 RepID=A0A200Q7Z6_MACCD|nr:tRNA transferase Trm5/Tyw2 [Macleaya cordata]